MFVWECLRCAGRAGWQYDHKRRVGEKSNPLPQNSQVASLHERAGRENTSLVRSLGEFSSSQSGVIDPGMNCRPVKRPRIHTQLSQGMQPSKNSDMGFWPVPFHPLDTLFFRAWPPRPSTRPVAPRRRRTVLIAHKRDSPSKLVNQASSRTPGLGFPERLVGPAFLLLCWGSTHNPAHSVTVLFYRDVLSECCAHPLQRLICDSVAYDSLFQLCPTESIWSTFSRPAT